MTDFTPRRDVQAISHVNVVVDDVEVATEFYRTVLGFEQAANADGPMDYPGVDLASFARDAGFDDGRISLDVRFLKHPEVGVYLELFAYHHPKGDQTIRHRKTNDLGGIRHVAVEVPDAVAAYAFIRFQQQAYKKRGLHIEILGQDHIPEEITPFPYKFFYWIDPWGVQWEMEQGRPVDIGVRRMPIDYSNRQSLPDIAPLNVGRHHPGGYVMAKKDGHVYFFSVKARDRFGQDRKPNPGYNIYLAKVIKAPGATVLHQLGW